MKTLRFSTRFQKDVKLCQKQGKNLNKLEKVLEILKSEESIPPQYKDHPLKNNWLGYRNLHIEPDWVLIYKIQNDEIILLAATGTHSHIL